MSNETTVPEISIETLKDWLAADSVLLVDVREQNEWDAAHLEQAMLLPLSRFDPAQIPDAGDKHTVIMCRSGRRSANATEVSMLAGRKDIFNLTGGILAWQGANYPVVSGS